MALLGTTIVKQEGPTLRRDMFGPPGPRRLGRRGGSRSVDCVSHTLAERGPKSADPGVSLAAAAAATKGVRWFPRSPAECLPSSASAPPTAPHPLLGSHHSASRHRLRAGIRSGQTNSDR